ncbi:MAG: branched-chain amino acid ABC transporter permease [Proteobacteria bacterium]|nr:branched-chain amino acid ABC transporter permease [Pseudomonadota bacterium]
MDNYLIAMATIACVYGLMTVSLNLSWGVTGMVNLGIAGFFGIGAYTSALLTTRLGWPVVAGVASAMVAGALVGAVLSIATLRLRDDYLAIVTLGFAEIVRLVALNELWLTNGSDGISGIPAPIPRGYGYGFSLAFLALIAALLALAAWSASRLQRSPYGRVLRAIRDDADVTAVAGKDVVRFKLKTFALSTAIAGAAGAMYGHYTSFVAPDLFAPLLTIYIFLALTIGGTGNVKGAVLGAFVLIAILEGSRYSAAFLPELSAVQQSAVREMVVAALFLLCLRFRPRGLVPERMGAAGE